MSRRDLQSIRLKFTSNLRLVPDRESKEAKPLPLVLNGEPMGKGWKPPLLVFANGKPKKADFYPVGKGGFVCSERGRNEWAPLEDEGEFFLVKIRGLQGKFYLYNLTNCLNCLDPKKTQWKKGVARGQPGCVQRPAFRPERVEEACLFKLAEDAGTTLYCLERSGDFWDGELKALTKKHRLKGVEFTKVFEVDVE